MSPLEKMKRQYRRGIGSVVVAKTIAKMGGGDWVAILGDIENKDKSTLRLVRKVKAHMANVRYG